eukprot:834376-Amphidinium_carterae.1
MGICVAANSTPSVVRITAMTPRTIRPDGMDSCLVHQSRLVLNRGHICGAGSNPCDLRQFGTTASSNGNSTWRRSLCRWGQRKQLRKVLHFFTTSHAQVDLIVHSKSTLRPRFMPNTTECRIESTPSTLICFTHRLLKVSKALSAKTGLQATKVKASRRHFSTKHTSRVPLDTM